MRRAQISGSDKTPTQDVNHLSEHNSTSEAIDVTSLIGASGLFIEMATAGTLPAISKLIRECGQLTVQLRDIEERLQGCNNPVALASLQADCSRRKVDFVTQLQKLAHKLEAKKAVIMAKLLETKARIACEEPALSTSIHTLVGPAISSVLSRRFTKAKRDIDPNLVARFAVIDQHLDNPNLYICKKLDQFGRKGDVPNDRMPEGWYERFKVTTFVQAHAHPECRKLLHKMFSERRRCRRTLGRF